MAWACLSDTKKCLINSLLAPPHSAIAQAQVQPFYISAKIGFTLDLVNDTTPFQVVLCKMSQKGCQFGGLVVHPRLDSKNTFVLVFL